MELEVVRTIDGPLEAVFDRYTDHLSWNEWAGVGEVSLDREGVANKNGVGCIRKIGREPMAAFEEVIEFDPPKRMVYRLLRGAIPLENHRGEVLFEPEGEGRTRITWSAHFDSGVPGLGWFFKAMTKMVFVRTLTGLSKTSF